MFVEEIGKVRVRKSKRSKNVSISIKPNRGITLTIPYFLSYKHGLNVLARKKSWILKHLPKIEAIENNKTLFTEESIFKTSKRSLLIYKNDTPSVKGKITSDEIIIFYPENKNIESVEIQEQIRTIIIKALRSEAKEYLPTRTAELAKKLNFSYNKIFIKNNKTLWGSCSGKNNINLNLHLMLLPKQLVDYVIIHELCHTVEKNHGDGFWRLMDSILGDSKKWSKELKKYSIQL